MIDSKAIYSTMLKQNALSSILSKSWILNIIIVFYFLEMLYYGYLIDLKMNLIIEITDKFANFR